MTRLYHSVIILEVPGTEDSLSKYTRAPGAITGGYKTCVGIFGLHLLIFSLQPIILAYMNISGAR